MTSHLTIDLPFPISVNAIWRNSKGRTHISERYRTWKRAADNVLWLRRDRKSDDPRLVPVKGNFVAIITLDESKRGNKDCDNHSKVILDWLERSQLIDNDSLCDLCLIAWGNAPAGCSVEITGVMGKQDSHVAVSEWIIKHS